jgi:hypothetical protein
MEESNMNIRTLGIFCLFLFVLIPASPIAMAQTTTPQATTANPANPPWPRKFVDGLTTVSVYQPQLDKWQDNQLSAFSAVEVQTGSAKDSLYGVMWFQARTEVDKINREVTLMDLNIPKANFPTATNNGQDYVNIVKLQMTKQPVISLDHLEADLNLTQAQIEAKNFPLDNDPPTILFSTTPAVLVLIDGQPALRPVEKTKLSRVINTKSLILFDPAKNLFLLQLMDGWMQAPAIEGAWTVASKVPKDADKIKDKLVQSGVVTLIDAGPNQSLKTSKIPIIYTSTFPAELLQSQGQPQLTPIVGTELLYVSNTSSNIFMNTGDQNYYILVAGRWFKAKAMSGPWSYVEGKALPADFGKIPTDSPKAGVLVSIPGTPEAKEALIANQIPQTATITRSQVNLTVSYDGSPQFKPVKDTTLEYAVNTATPVIEVSETSYYAVQNGVWFTAAAATGPWVAATSVPGVIYTIPPSSPIHYVTYVKIYGSTDQVIYVGYTPGYYGTVVSTDNVVVYGTGYVYPAYVGTVWVGTPYTYGVGAGFAWGAAVGWSMAFGVGYAYGGCYPWWGPVGYAGAYWGPAVGWGAWGGAAATNVYGHWGNTAYQGTRAAWANPYTGNVGTAARGTSYNSVTGASTAARGFQNTNAYTGNQVGAAGGVHYNPTTGIVSGGRAGYAGNAYTGNYEAGGKGFAYDTKTGQGATTSGLYGDHDGNVYKQSGSGWQQFDHNSGSWGSAGSHDFSGLNGWAGSRSFGGMRAGNFGGFHGGGGFRR